MPVEVITDMSRQISVDQIINALFGMSVEELAKEIRDDVSGQYEGIVLEQAV